MEDDLTGVDVGSLSTFEKLPVEILERIIKNLVQPWVLVDDLPDWGTYLFDEESRARRKGLVSLARTSKHVSYVASTFLYRCVHLHDAMAVRQFHRTMSESPHMPKMIGQMACHSLVDEEIPYSFHLDYRDTRLTPLDCSSGKQRASRSPPYVSVYLGINYSFHTFRDMILKMTHIRTLSINQSHLADGPHLMADFIPGDPTINCIIMPCLTKIRISVPYEPEQLQIARRFDLWTRSLAWLDPVQLGIRFPSLKYLEILMPGASWAADMFSKPALKYGYEGPDDVRKYIKTLTTTNTSKRSLMVWALEGLQSSMFSSSHLDTLRLDSPKHSFQLARFTGFHVSNILANKGQGLQVLSLEWQTEAPWWFSALGPFDGQVHFGTVIGLGRLPKLRDMAISLQALFGLDERARLDAVNEPAIVDAWIVETLPPSLEVLRINEWLPGIGQAVAGLRRARRLVFATGEFYSPDWQDHLRDLQELTEVHATHTQMLIETLKMTWLARDERRQLWFKRLTLLDTDPWVCNTDERARLRESLSVADDKRAEQNFLQVARLPLIASAW